MKNTKKGLGKVSTPRKAPAAGDVAKLRKAFARMRAEAEKSAIDNALNNVFGYPYWADYVLKDLNARVNDLRHGQLGNCDPIGNPPRDHLRRLLALSPYAVYHEWELDEDVLKSDDGARHAAAFDCRNPFSDENIPHRTMLNKGRPARKLMPECEKYAAFVNTFDQYVTLLAICAKTAGCFDAASAFLNASFDFRAGVHSLAGCVSAEDADKLIATINAGLRTLRVFIVYEQLPDLREFTCGE